MLCSTSCFAIVHCRNHKLYSEDAFFVSIHHYIINRQQKLNLVCVIIVIYLLICTHIGDWYILVWFLYHKPPQSTCQNILDEWRDEIRTGNVWVH